MSTSCQLSMKNDFSLWKIGLFVIEVTFQLVAVHYINPLMCNYEYQRLTKRLGVFVIISNSPSVRYAYVYGRNKAVIFSECWRGRQPKLSYTITQRTHQFHPLIRQRRTRYGMEANKQFWCVFITIKRDFQPPSVAGVVQWLQRLSPAATRLCYCEGQSRDTDIKKMHPAKVIVQSLDALLHGSWRESLCDVYISTFELRFLHVPMSFLDVSMNWLMDQSCCTESPNDLFLFCLCVCVYIRGVTVQITHGFRVMVSSGSVCAMFRENELLSKNQKQNLI